MKKYLLMAAALFMGSAMFTSCSDDDDDDVKEKIYTVTFEGDYFTKLIDNPQYQGPLIYSGAEYKWTDETTKLSSSCTKEDWSQWGEQYAGQWGWKNGIAISNYIDNAETASFDKQLAVPESNGSANFAVVWDDGSELAFADGKAHLIKTMDVCLTTYTLRNIQKNWGENYFFQVVVTATLADGTEKRMYIELAKDKTACKQWMTAHLENLGAVKSIKFTFDGSDKGEWGLATPKYFALDNVVVVL